MRNLLAILAASIALSSTAAAETIDDQSSRVTLEVPAGWTHRPVNSALSIDEPAKEVNFTIVVVDAADLKQAAANAAGMLKKITSKLKLDRGKKLDLNGMAAMGFKGTAMLGPKPIKIALIVAVTPANKGLLVIGLADAARFKNHKKQVDAFLASIAPLRK